MERGCWVDDGSNKDLNGRNWGLNAGEIGCLLALGMSGRIRRKCLLFLRVFLDGRAAWRGFLSTDCLALRSRKQEKNVYHGAHGVTEKIGMES